MKHRLVLLPGMDGTGDLFADFRQALPDDFEIESVRYPAEAFLSYSELMLQVSSAALASQPFVLVAESFSAPLAIQYAATSPPNLKGLVLCAGFATSPVHGWRRFMGSLLLHLVFRFPLPKLAVKLVLVGWSAQPRLIDLVLRAVSSVKPEVLSARLRAVLTCDVRVELGRIDVPILYVQATQDRLVGALCLDEIQRIRPETAVEKVEGPHLILQKEAQQTAELVAAFVRQLM